MHDHDHESHPSPRTRAVEAALDLYFPPAFDERPRGPRSALPTVPSIPGYEVESLLGSGGMGVVYRARHLRLNRTVAIKMLRAGSAATARELTCLLREAEAVAGLRHPNIVQVHDVGDLGGLAYFTMEFMDGGTLAEEWAAGGVGVPQPAERAVALLITIAGAVDAAHRGGIVHRDLKPANILRSADGTHKVADFSLAARLSSDSAQTLSTARVGTPSYMAPEQALGRAHAFCPAVDLYALGAILYEALTGRPPFRGESSEETQRQVIEDEPVPPSRLNPRVPRDLETICLTCLAKSPARRYASAAALQADLERFQRGEPIAARPAGMIERAMKWVRRRPAQAITAASILALAVAAGGLITWLGLAREAQARLVARDLSEVREHQTAAEWTAARTALERAKARIGIGADAALPTSDLGAAIAAIERELDLVNVLDHIRLDRVAIVDGRYRLAANGTRAAAAYEDAFRAAQLLPEGLDAMVAPPADILERIRASGIRSVLVSALDDWAACTSRREESDRRAWLLALAQAADDDPTGWRRDVREPALWNDGVRLAEVAARAPAEAVTGDKRSTLLLLAVCDRLTTLGLDPVPLLTRIQREHPEAFWANFSLGIALAERQPAEALRYFQASVALRPDAAMAHANLGVALGVTGALDEAAASLERAIALEPTLAQAHTNLGNVAMLRGDYATAIAECERAVDLDPTSPTSYRNLGKALADSGRHEEALAAFEASQRLDPESAATLASLGLILERLGRLDEAVARSEEAVALDPRSAAAQINLAVVLRTRGEWAASLTHVDRAIALEPTSEDAHYVRGMTLRPLGRASEAEAAVREAIRLNPRMASALHTLGTFVGDAGDLDGAIDYFRRAIAANPKHVLSYGALGRVLMVQGHFAEAREAFLTYQASLPANDPRRAPIDGFLRECDQAIAADSREATPPAP